ncbi:putative secreted protein [Streptomyces himastatinicus ATCC 53653]|uniref:Putative secreted protein n=1 Tax=Streptomyces himastatinicus ATCC 53653 TaxID=457427 RepID=D9W906_9ACTN|nr:Ig-like domain-containing protein [Streptomyces himastatinicus]EFL26788.1 putative secreted protein [Streptomyces himastatinicus ATCC 53653]
MNHTPRSPRTRAVLSSALLVASLIAGLSGCGGPSSDPLSAKPYDAADQISFSGESGAHNADPDRPLQVTAKGDDGRITDVTATDAAGRYVRGELAPDGSRWRSTVPLAAGAHYTLRVSTEDSGGAPGRRTIDFTTSSKRRLLKVTFGPKSGEYGVGQPVTAKLSRPVKDPSARAVVERGLKVDSQPAVEGVWHWVNSKTLHYRPAEYWPAHATVKVRSNLKGIRVGGGLYGGDAKPLRITTGDRIEALTDSGTHQMTVRRNGQVIRTIPITTGMPGFDTRNGTKVILAKESAVRMTGASIGLGSGSYDLMVYWAARVTESGEYVHAAPWSTGSQGYANVSHGCTGMSTANAQWFFNTVHLGDLVKVVNSNGDDMATFGNGYGDWNMAWTDWRQGSALAAGQRDGSTPADSARLRPMA